VQGGAAGATVPGELSDHAENQVGPIWLSLFSQPVVSGFLIPGLQALVGLLLLPLIIAVHFYLLCLIGLFELMSLFNNDWRSDIRSPTVPESGTKSGTLWVWPWYRCLVNDLGPYGEALRMTTSNTFGEWLKQRRRQLDLTQQELADQVGCSVGTIRKIEGNARRPSKQLAELMAGALKIPLAQEEAFIIFSRTEAYMAGMPAALEMLERAAAETPPPSPIPMVAEAESLLQIDLATPLQHNLPPQPTPFIGREVELAALNTLLADPEKRLITIVGPGGMGKTRLSLACAEHTFENGRFPNGVYFIPLTPISNTVDIASAIALSLNLKFYGGKSPLEQLLNHLREQDILLVLDNFEHLVAGADLLTDILLSAPQVKLLITSRERLALQQEWIYELQGLTYPTTREQIGEAEADATAFSSVELFVQRAQRAKATFSLSPENLPHILHICQLMNGMPLGLELAAAWVPLMSCQEIAAEISHSLDFLATTLRDVPERHRSLRAVFESSWNLLTSEEQAVYQRMSVFRGGFTRSAVEEVTGALLPQLANLIGKSLLRRARSGRYEIHELLRQFVAEKLAASPAAQEAAHAAHAAYFATFLKTRRTDLQGNRQLAASGEIAAEFENVRTAWHWIVNHRDAERLNDAAWSLFDFCEMSGRPQVGMELFQTAVETLQHWSEATATETQAQTLAQLLTGYGMFSTRVGANEQLAQDLLRQSASLLRPLQPAAIYDLAYMLVFQGEIRYLAGDASAASRLLEEALTLARSAENEYLVGLALQALGLTAEFQGEFRRAERFFRESINVFRNIGEKRYRAYSLNNWGRAAYGMGAYAKAEELIQKALTIRRQFNDLIGIAFSLLDLGKLAYMRGDYSEAEYQMQASLNIAEQISGPDLAARANNGLGWVARARGDLAQAEEFHLRSLTIYQEIGFRRALPLTFNSLAEVALGQQDYQRAKQYLDESLAISKQLSNAGDLASALWLSGNIALAEGATTKAATDYRHALEIVFRTGAAPLALDTNSGQAMILLRLVRDHPATTRELHDKAETLLANLPDITKLENGPAEDLWTTVTNLIAGLK
jgi:predicted ATPase/DNA-binding XRE family transcriptional regulator/Tfp pilus assembly protein PilF